MVLTADNLNSVIKRLQAIVDANYDKRHVVVIMHYTICADLEALHEWEFNSHIVVNYMTPTIVRSHLGVRYVMQLKQWPRFNAISFIAKVFNVPVQKLCGADGC